MALTLATDVARLHGRPPAATAIQETVPDVPHLPWQAITKEGMDLLMWLWILITLAFITLQGK